jgi:hypothetical protein
MMVMMTPNGFHGEFEYDDSRPVRQEHLSLLQPVEWSASHPVGPILTKHTTEAA